MIIAQNFEFSEFTLELSTGYHYRTKLVLDHWLSFKLTRYRYQVRVEFVSVARRESSLTVVKVKKAKGNPNINMGNKAATTAPPLYDESIEHYVRRGHFYRHSKDNDTDLGELPPHHEKVALAAGRC